MCLEPMVRPPGDTGCADRLRREAPAATTTRPVTPEVLAASDLGAGRCQQAAVASACAAYYRAKTAAIIDRYGPGPRIHYHIGLFGDSADCPPAQASDDQLKAMIVAAQERLLDRAAQVWQAGTTFTGHLLDVGCGLGGGAIYWAQRYPVLVTAMTNVAEHADAVLGFAAVAGVADRVRPLITDVAAFRTGIRYCAAVALESSCYMPRPQMFRQVAAALAPGGVFGIEDIFVARPGWAALFDAYWRTSIGTVAQYREAALDAGLRLEEDLDVTEETSPFWRYSMAWARARLAAPGVCPSDRERLARSISWHRQFLRGWRYGAYRVRVLRFRKPG
jgi:SAM-dependent methyltransferase